MLVRGLIDRGAPVNRPEFSSESGAQHLASQFVTPLEAAAKFGHLDIVKLLLQSGADTDSQCCSGETALFFAAEAGHLLIVEALLQAGANPTLSGNSGSPIDAARRGGHKEILSMLTDASGGHK